MPDAKRPDPKRRSPASRPGKAGDSVRRRRSAKPSSKPSSRTSPTTGRTTAQQEHVVEPITRQAAESVEQRSEQRLGFTARRAAVLAAVICVLTLTIAGPVRTYFAQRTEMKQLKATEEQLRAQIADLEQQKVKLADPVFVAAQARERLGFVMPGEIPYQVQLPANAAVPGAPDEEPTTAHRDQPWYTALWHTIADAPHGISPAPLPGRAPAPGLPEPPSPVPPAPGG